MKRLPMLIGILGLLLASAVSAKVEVLEFESPAHEERYNKLIAELRCLVCQNQNLADSDAELAVDLRRKTYEMVSKDKSENEIAEYMVERYGDFVLYRPPLNSNTLLLWVGPFIILLVGVSLLIRTIRRRRAEQGINVDDATLKAAATLLDSESDKRDA
jgi:cytochrome c-type biogenesis protein CcmH